MTRLLRHLVTSLMVCLTSLFITIPALAIPSLPSSFYGEVRVNDVYVPDGTVVRAVIDGQVCAEGYTQTYQGASVFTLDIPGDDTATTTLDGGRDGDKVQFEIGGVLADQTGVWHSGTSIRLDLTASAAGILDTPQATPSPVPTQTPIVLVQPSSTKTTLVQSLTTETTFVQPLPTMTPFVEPALTATATALMQLFPTMTPTSQSSQKLAVFTKPSPNSTEIVYGSPEPASLLNPEEDDTVTPTLTVASIGVAIITGSALWVIRKRMYLTRNSTSSKQHNSQGGS